MWGKRFGIEIKHICHVANRSVFTKPSFSAIKGPKSSKQGFRGEVKKITTIQEIYYISIQGTYNVLCSYPEYNYCHLLIDMCNSIGNFLTKYFFNYSKLLTYIPS